MHSHQVQSLDHDDKALKIFWKDGKRSKFNLMWLRDNCSEDCDPRNGQKLVDIADMPEKPQIAEMTWNVAEQGHDDRLFISWGNEAKESQFSLAWLRSFCEQGEVSHPHMVKPICWFAEHAHQITRASYQEVLESKEVQVQLLQGIAEYGIAFLSNVPTQEGEILTVAKLFGYVRETNYGALFEVRSIPDPNNLAYTDLGLGVHTDNPYRDPVPGLQALHCLKASPSGGENIFIDGFAVAKCFAKENPEDYRILTSTPVPFKFQDKTTELYAEWPLIQLNLRGEVIAIQYNNRSIATNYLPFSDVEAFYPAYRRFALKLREKRFEFCDKLGGGQMVIFNNRRILHGRKAFDAENGPRHLQGVYIDQDGLYSHLAVLKRG